MTDSRRAARPDRRGRRTRPGRRSSANLASHGYRVLEAADVATALRSWEAGRPDLILLDLGLPDGDGSTVIRRVRRDATTPILVLTARGTEPDKVTALESRGGRLRDEAVRAGRASRAGRGAAPAGGWPGRRRDRGPAARPDRHRRRPSTRSPVGGTPLDLTPREYELLKTMVAQPGRLLTSGRLLRAVWGTAYSSEAHYLHVYVSRLRRKLDAADPTGSASGLIVAEPGVGYRIGGGRGRDLERLLSVRAAV